MMLRSAYFLAGYYLTLVLFAVFGLTLNLFCLLLGWLPATPRNEKFFQRLVGRHFALFLWWMEFARLVRVRYAGLERLGTGGCVIVANHPGLMDITYLLARIPDAVCIFKPGIRRNPILGAAARRAGYIANDGGPDLVRAAADKVAAGGRLVIFPEGTRTPPGMLLGTFRPGFVLMARRAGAPIQLVRIAWDSNVLVKGRAWWKLPRLPALIEVTAGPVINATAGGNADETAARIERWFRAGTAPEAPLA